MSRSLVLACLLSSTMMALAALGDGEDKSKIERNITYSKAAGARGKLDVYAPGEGENHPVVVWLHGGGWRRGDKMLVAEKPRGFTARGYVFIAANYRFRPEVTVEDEAQDVATAVRWARDHAREHGGDPTRIFIGGHSAGAHLAALVATDGRYLEKAGMKLADLSGAILLDGAAYDVSRQIEQSKLPALKKIYVDAFTEDPKAQKDASPITHVAAKKGIPPFLILHVASRADAREQSNALAEKLRKAGGEAKVVVAEGKTHATINGELGKPGDKPTEAVFAFLKERAEKPRPKQAAGVTRPPA